MYINTYKFERPLCSTSDQKIIKSSLVSGQTAWLIKLPYGK